MPSASAPRDVALLVVDEHGVGGADPLLVQHVPVDLLVRLEQVELPAHVARREEVAERAVPEVAAVIRAGVGQQRQPGPAGLQVGEHLDGAGVDRQPAAEVGRPQLVHPRVVPARADVGGDRLPVGGDSGAAQVEAVPVREVGAPERRLAVAAHPGQARDRLPVDGRLRQRDDLAVVDDNEPAGQRDGRTGHCGSPAAIEASSPMLSAANLPSSPTGCRTTWSAPASRCSRMPALTASAARGDAGDEPLAAAVGDVGVGEAEALQVAGVVRQLQVELGVGAGVRRALLARRERDGELGDEQRVVPET